VAVASAGPYASLHLASARQHPTTQFFTGWMPFLPPNQQCQSSEGIALLHSAVIRLNRKIHYFCKVTTSSDKKRYNSRTTSIQHGTVVTSIITSKNKLSITLQIQKHTIDFYDKCNRHRLLHQTAARKIKLYTAIKR